MIENELDQETVKDTSTEDELKDQNMEEVIETVTDVELDETEVDVETKLHEKETIAKGYLDKLQRTMAEYDNFRKRTIKEKSQMYENGAKEVFEKYLPIVDNFERALESASEEEKASSFVQGIEMIYKQLIGTMKELGVEEMDALFKEFDPNLHHAVSHEENENYGENEVIEVLQKGYTYKDRVLRFSMVKVAN
ncbi:MAG: nucleotide exchange factor GrpE [Firmicutes bacterium HGW-Firmicutes-7]|nr:MAG: nucleotide exchange factor GrpE [Firmicutes bacterium HGW-Firmicutes-7]